MKMKWEKLDSQNISDIAKMLKALSDPTRLKILRFLHAGESSVGAVVNEIKSSQANISKHLQILSQVKLVVGRREGTTIYYRIADPCVDEMCRIICGSYVELVNKKMTF